ncbi:hypothetical protein JCM14713_33720 [Desulfomicrobium salsuginis]
MPTLPEDEQVRGGVYLCQTGQCVSCGSCCGLYNVRGLSREGLRDMLDDRRRAFAAVPRTIDAILAFEQERLALEGRDHPIPDFHHCAFVGLIRDGGERVGCLLHPLADGNAGVDWRGLSFYGGAACKLFFCPTYDRLEARWKRLVRHVIDDWFAYGLIIPEHRLLAALLGAVEARLGRELDPDALSRDGQAALAELLRIKLDWPLRAPDAPLAWNFFSTRGTERTGFNADQSGDPLLLLALHELDTLPEHAAQALARLEALLDSAVVALSRK